MARIKSVWTVVLLIVLVCPYVKSRPQETSQAPSLSTTNNITEKQTESTIRYNHYKYKNVRFFNNRSSSPKDEENKYRMTDNKSNLSNSNNVHVNNSEKLYFIQDTGPNSKNVSNRSSKLIRRGYKNHVKNSNLQKQDQKKVLYKPASVSKPEIRRIITKWTDNAEDLSFSQESQESVEQDSISFSNFLNIDDSSSTEHFTIQQNTFKKPLYSTIDHDRYDNIDNNRKPDSGYNKLSVGHTNKVHLISYPFPSVRPSYIFTTPTPTPIITNLGNPKPWSQNYHINRQPTTQPVRVTKPLKDQHNYHNTHNRPQQNAESIEVSTFQPLAPTYTERIVIRPEEYSAMDECPTIYLTLNNTFQGQAKEACPDLNIAVNTNVVNKNVAIESYEDDGDGLFPDAFGALGDSVESAEVDASNDYADSDENPEEAENASVGSSEYSNYSARPATLAAEPGAPAAPAVPGAVGAPGGAGTPSSALTSKPGHGSQNDDDDTFSISGLMSFFKPAINAMSWLAAISPFSFTMMSLLLTPLTMLLAGYSGVAALFAPLGLAREAPKVVHVYRPKWEWDDKYKTWFLNTHPNDRLWRPIKRFPRLNSDKENEVQSTVRDTWFYRIKEWMKSATSKLKERQKSISKQDTVRKSQRRKRETWTRRIK